MGLPGGSSPAAEKGSMKKKPVRRFTHRFIRRIAVKLGKLLLEADSEIASATLPKFGSAPRNLTIDLPRKIINPERIFVGNDVMLGPGSFLYALTRYPGKSMAPNYGNWNLQQFDSRIIIGNRVTATGYLQIASQREVKIEDDVMFASNVFINDALHGYEVGNVPYKYQKLWKIKPIVIEKGSWIGQNVVILPGVTIGEYSIVGANSVVTRTIPKWSIAFGVPATVRKTWNEAEAKWEFYTENRNGS